MRILEFTDVHVTRSSEFSSPTDDGTNEYLQSVVKSLDFVYDQCILHKPDALVFGGDFYDARDFVDTMALPVGFKCMEKISSLPVKYKLGVVGNHDYFSVEHSIHMLSFMRGMGWEVYDEVSVKQYDGNVLGFLPFRDQYTTDQLKMINDAKPDVVFAHLDVLGGLRRKARNEKDTRAYSETGVLKDSLKDCGMILNGHYHHKSKVADNWYNIGSLTTRTFHDKDSPDRGIVLYDTTTRVLQHITNPHAKRFLDVHITNEEELAEVLASDMSNCYARVYFDLSMADHVNDVSEVFAGTRMVPVAKKAIQTAVTAIDLRFSLEENLDNYIYAEYGDEELKSLAIEILRSTNYATSGTTRKSMDFGTLKIENFQSFKNAEINLNSRGLLFVKGINQVDIGQDSNGAGKSTLIEAIYWCLTGQSFKDYTGNEVIHWDETYCSVSLELFIGDEVYTVVRSRKHPEYGTGVNLYIGGVSSGARISADTDKKLEDLIGRSETNLRHVCFLTTGLSHKFTSLGYAARARLLEDIIDSAPYKEAEEIAADRLGKANLRLSSVQGSMTTIKSQISHYKRELGDHEYTLANFTQESEKMITHWKTTLEDHDTLIKVLADEKSELDKSYQVAKSEVTALRVKSNSMQEALHSVQRDIAGVSSRLAVSSSEVNRIGSLLSKEMCPTCGVKVDQRHFHSQQDGFKIEADSLQVILNEHNARAELLRSRLDKLNVATNAALASQDSITMKRNVNDRTTRETLTEINHAKSELTKVGSTREGLEKMISMSKSNIERTQETYSTLDKEETELVKLTSLLTTLAKEVFNEKGVRNSLLAQVAIPYINARLPEYSAFLWGGQRVELTSSRELKGGKSKNEIDIVLGGRYTYKGCSAGQKRRLDLAIQFALNDLAIATGSSRIGFLALDEVLDACDDLGIYAAKEILRQKSEHATILMVSHSKYAAAITPSQIVVRRVKDVTTLEEQNAAPVME